LDCVDKDRRALASGRLVVKVVERSTEALVEDRRAAKSQGAICADGETASEDGTILWRTIKLELVVRSDVSGASVGVKQLSTRQGLDESARASAADNTLIKASFDIPFARCCRDICNCDHERAGECRCTSWRSSSSWGDVGGDSLRDRIGEDSSSESSESECVLHLETCLSDVEDYYVQERCR